MSASHGPSHGALVVRGVTKSFGTQQVLSGVDLDVPSGAVAAVLGPSGSGKTTLLRIVAGFERPDSGSVAIGDAVVDDARHHVAVDRRRIGYVSQEGSLFPHLDVRKNVGFGLSARRGALGTRGGRGPRQARRVDELLELVDLQDFGDRYPHQLSGGQQQRVAIARALAPRPALVLLDEPFASLDANLRAQVRAEVRDVLRRSGTTAVLVTHDQDEALSVADVVAVLRAGAIAQVDGPTELYAHPVDAEVAAFVGEANLVDGRVSRTGAAVETLLGTLPLHRPFDGDGVAVVVLVRPEQLVVATGACGGVPARVVSAEYHGHDTTVRLVPLVPGLPEAMVARVVGNLEAGTPNVVRLGAGGPVEAWQRAPGEAGVPGSAPARVAPVTPAGR